MSALWLRVALGNDAMRSTEDLAGALEQAARKLREGRREAQLLDGNGNTVGSFGIDPGSPALPCDHPTFDEDCRHCTKAAAAALEAQSPFGAIWYAVMDNDSAADQLADIYELLGQQGWKVP